MWKANILLQEEETFFALLPERMPDIHHVPVCVFLQKQDVSVQTSFFNWKWVRMKEKQGLS